MVSRLILLWFVLGAAAPPEEPPTHPLQICAPIAPTVDAPETEPGDEPDSSDMS